MTSTDRSSDRGASDRGSSHRGYRAPAAEANAGVARMALDRAELVIREPMIVVQVTADYATWAQVEILVASLGGSVEAEFGGDVHGRITVHADAEQVLRERLADMGVQADG